MTWGQGLYLDGVYTGQDPCYCAVSSNDQQPQVGQAPKQLQGLLRALPRQLHHLHSCCQMFAAEDENDMATLIWPP